MTSAGVVSAYVLSLFVGLTLQFVQPPALVAPVWPLWTTVLLAAWAFNAPRLPHLACAVLIGCLLDVGLSSVLGEHALALLVTTYAAARLRTRADTLPGWQIGILFAAVWLVNTGILFLIDRATHHEAVPLLRWGPVVAQAALWPFVNRLVRGICPPPPRALQ